ncbi:MAG: DNA-directed RNA polymerase subunit beta' [Bacteroidetes bacterium]|nr:DNA-directed RNA polymerase subunit beta' [Bacteroidota bacterium]
MKILDTKDFNNISIRLASPERISEWSFGEVTKPETINYRTGRSERGGLFDEKIFGPEKDYECYCKKYRGVKYKGIICEKCGVEVTKAIVRRDRMGHIELASPVAHIWFLRGVPSRMSVFLNITLTDLEKVIYFAGYIITKVNQDEKNRIIKDLESEYKTKIKSTDDDATREKLKELFSNTKRELSDLVVGKVLNEIEYHHYGMRYGAAFEASIGAEAIYNIFKNVDLKKLQEETEKMIEEAGTLEKVKLKKRLGLLRSMITSNVRPEWMFIKNLPVIPPGLRPMVALEGGRHATSDINDLYRRVINRNNRLRKLIEINAPDVILRNEKRILQEAVDALIDNSIAKSDAAMNQSQKRALKSLSDNLKSKQGLFRQNLLGKRVDYSGRSVIVVGPQLKLNQCGLPKKMALELFKPFVISKILERELAFNIRGANKLIEDGVSEVWAILEEVIQGKYVLLNRAPTLHRLGIQAFNPILVEGKAIQVHPLVCSAFNADFDGDQMAVYLPLSEAAQAEAKNLMAANKNLLKPQDGNPIVHPRMDIVLGTYWMTKMVSGEKGEGKYFASPNEAMTAYDYGQVSFRTKIKVLPTDSPRYVNFDNKPFETTVGRIMFNSSLPKDFPYINEEMTQKRLSRLVDEIITKYGVDETPKVLDMIKSFGFKFVAKSGISWGIDNVIVPEGKTKIVEDSRKKVFEIENQWSEGLLSEEEKTQKTIAIWESAKIEINKLLPDTLKKNGPTKDMLDSQARGTIAQLSQMAGMKGLIVNTAGKTIDFPVIPSYKEGLSPIEYFITTHGSRKGLADTALKTAQAGYLTRRLVDVSQDVVIREEDCGTKAFKVAKAENISGLAIALSKNIFGRTLAEDVVVGNQTFEKGSLVDKDIAMAIEASGIKEVKVRSVLSCETKHGICQKCYGLDLGRSAGVKLGEAIGIIAAQAIGEPGTQLTLRTFHAGGVAGTDITQGLPRVEEIFERRNPKNPAIVSETDGEVFEIREEGKDRIIKVLSDSKGDKKTNEMEYAIPFRRTAIVKVGDKVKKGELLTDGSAKIGEIFKIAGKEMAENYIIDEINKVYEVQGAPIARKHLEIIVRQMFSRRKILDAGDTDFAPNEIVESVELEIENENIKSNGGKPAVAEMIVRGITDVSLTTKSWLSAASFQNTNRVLINNAIKGGIDGLRGLKENVIIGRLIPAGTGFRGEYKHLDQYEDIGEEEKPRNSY